MFSYNSFPQLSIIFVFDERLYSLLKKILQFLILSMDYLSLRRQHLLNQQEIELATLDSVQSELEMRRAEILNIRHQLRSTQNLPSIAEGNTSFTPQQL